jgi:hypothetical protein
MRTAEDLVVQALRAIIIAEIESNLPILVLDYKFDSHIAGPGAHGLQLERSVVAREHAIFFVARVPDEATGFLWIEGEALAKCPRRSFGRHAFFPHLSVGPSCAVFEALGLSALSAKGEHASNGGEDRGCLHFACWFARLYVLVFGMGVLSITIEERGV